MLHFEVQPKYGQRANYGPSVKSPNQYPSFVMVFNDDWNDYGYRTWFCLFYFDEHRGRHYVGELKLMKLGDENTYDVIEKSFDGSLGEEYCSVGLEPYYYSKIYELFQGTVLANELLTDLRDCAYNQNIYEDFAEDDCFKNSLMREDSSQQAVKEAAFLLGGQDKAAAYSFDLHFNPDYLCGAYTDWSVRLLYDAPPFMRAVGLIGNNGVGKTQMLKHLITTLIEEIKEPVVLPLFRSCLAISSTPFDGYDDIGLDNPRIPYKHFSLEQNFNNTEQGILKCIETIYHRPLIHSKSMIKLYKESIDSLLGETVGCFLTYNEFDDTYDLDDKFLHKQISIMSSGQLHIFNLLTFIYAHIHLTSLLVIDEPEVHMHPQIIVSFMSMLGIILNQFSSFAIIATHSPLIVREMVGQNVYLMRTVDGVIPNVSKVAFETFGADASELYLNIFDYNEKISSFYHYVNQLGKKMNYNEAMHFILQFAPKLGLNARLSIRDYLEEGKDA